MKFLGGSCLERRTGGRVQGGLHALRQRNIQQYNVKVHINKYDHSAGVTDDLDPISQGQNRDGANGCWLHISNIF